jgi:hypothetical protein
MIRRLFYDLLLFALPFALYWAYLQISGHEDAEGHARSHPWTALFIAGMVLVAASFVLWGLSEGEPANGVYVPPHIENGAIVPGHVDRPADER